jgi:hypothetical protein
MQRKVTLSTRVDKKLRAALEIEAAADRRTVTSMLEKILADHFAAESTNPREQANAQ